MWSVMTTVWGISVMFPFNGALEGTNVQEWIFKANDTIAYLAVTDLNQQRAVSTLECDVKCSQYPDCIITVYNRSTSLCAMFRLFDRTQDKTPTILHGNFDVRHFMVIANICPCQPPPLTNAKVSDGSRLVGSIRTYTCHQAYRNTSTNDITAHTTCLGNLTWSRVALKCSVPTCPSQPPSLANAKVSDGSRLVGSIRTYKCHHGYRDTSTYEMTVNTTCLANLTWSHAALKCSVQRCPSQPPSLKHADISRGGQVVGSIRRYRCHHGYRDKSTSKTTTTAKCLPSLTWGHPKLQCSAYSCPNKPPPIDNAMVKGKGLSVGSVWQYTCDSGYMDSETSVANTACLDNLTWSHTPLQCTGPWLLKITPAKCKIRKLTKTELKKVFVNETFIFLVQTCHNAYVHFKEYKNNEMIESGICIGCGENTYWEIRGCQVKNEKDVVSCTEFRPFWIRFHVDTVAVGKGLTVGEREAMSCRVSDISLIHFGLSTCAINEGVWQFQEQWV